MNKYVHGGSPELTKLLEALGVPTNHLTRFNLMCGAGELVTVHTEYCIPVQVNQLEKAIDIVKTFNLVVK